MTNRHSFHIPVMGIGYTLETPLKVSQYGIDSVISLVDDILLEKLRKVHCNKHELSYVEITENTEDFRARRITSYLNMLNELAENKIAEFKSAAVRKSNEIRDYFNMLPDSSTIKEEFKNLSSKYLNISDFKSWIKENITPGSIDVNIMTKVDKDNYRDGEKLPVEYNDAHAALRGYALSNLRSSIILSAGMNPRLYSYMGHFDDFYPDEQGDIKKKIVLKVSDYRSALIQGKFLAKKGLWVSEYRIESGLNCGGHAFATEGHLMGPILAEFRDNKQDLIQAVYEILVVALQNSGRTVPNATLPMKITAQGGVGTAEEHQFLLDHYQVDSVGWGTPFLLVPEATSVDSHTLQQLTEAKEDDLSLSNISPLGVPFNTLKGNTKEIERLALLAKGRPGSACPKKFVGLNFEFTKKGICTASRKYQRLKIEQLNAQDLDKETYASEYEKIVEKSCICVGLGTSTLLVNEMDTKVEGEGVSICPSPNMAYFDKVISLKEMVDHIYGRTNVISRTDRPHMFTKELNIYIDFLKNKIEETRLSMTSKQEAYLNGFAQNLREGITYYTNLFTEIKGVFEDTRDDILRELQASLKALSSVNLELRRLAVTV